MKRPLLWYAGAYALGEVLALQCGGLWLAFLFLAAGAASAGYGWKRRVREQKRRGRLTMWLLLPLFFAFGYLRLSRAGDPAPIRELDGRLSQEGELAALLSGKVARMELRNADGEESFRLLISGCQLRIEEAATNETKIKEIKIKETKIKETELFPVEGVLLTLDELPEGVREGRTVLMRVRLSEMEAPGNPGQFDSRGYYRGQGISYRAKGTACLGVSGRTDWLRCGLRLLRQYFAENLFRTAGEESGGMLCAMVLGEKWEADEAAVSLYTESGIGHLLAISGLHISMAGMSVYQLLRKRLKCPYVLAAFGCTAMSFCYYLLTGEGTSAGRAFFMLTVYGVGQVLGRQYDLASGAALAALVMLARRPLLLFQSGFLLSFGSVLGLGILYPLFSQAGFPKVVTPFLPGISIQLATSPVQACFFYKLPVYSLFLNLAVLPLFTAAALLGIAGALLGGVFPGLLSAVLLPARGILWLYGFLGAQSLRLPGAVFRTGRPKLWQLLSYAVLLVFLYRRLKKRTEEKTEERMKKKTEEKTEEKTEKKTAGKGRLRRKPLDKRLGRRLCGCLIPFGMALCLIPVRFRGIELTFLDVGQGDGCFLRTCDGVTFLIDGGSSDEKRVGEYRLGPFLDHQGEAQVDYALVSHGDADHINGISELIGQGRIGTLILPRGREGGEGLASLKKKAEEAGVPVLTLSRGERIRAGEAVFTCLWPEFPGETGGSLGENEASMVLWLSWKELDVLFTGDLEGSGEAALISCLEAEGGVPGAKADILKVPHHGSGGTSSAAFLEAVRPKYGIISCGKNNRYGHPAGETLERLSDAGCRVFRTDRDGAVTVRSGGSEIEIYGYR